MIRKCMCCGKEDTDRWMHSIFTGRYGTLWYCNECYVSNRNKLADINYKKKVKISEAKK